MNNREIVDNIRKLWLLQLIVDSGSFREAAIRAKVTQSALSQTVSQLETLTGSVLLRRDRGSVEPTLQCQELLVRVQPVLNAVEQVAHSEHEGAPNTLLNLGAYESFSYRFIPELIRRLQLKSPAIRLKLRVAKSGVLATLVRKGDLSLAVIRELDDMPRLDVIEISNDRIGFWASPTHPVVGLGWDGIPKFEIGTLSPDTDGHPRYHTRLLEAAKLKKMPTFVCDSFESLRAAAQKGVLIAVLPESLASSDGPPLVEIRSPHSKLLGNHKIVLISRPGGDLREKEFITSELKDVVT